MNESSKIILLLRQEEGVTHEAYLDSLGYTTVTCLPSMAYQMGVNGLANFHQALTAISQEDWEDAATQMLNSIWAKQTPARAWRYADVIRSG